MKFFSIIFLFTLLSSCGNLSKRQGHLRFVRVNKQEIPVIEKNESPAQAIYQQKNDANSSTFSIANSQEKPLESLDEKSSFVTPKLEFSATIQNDLEPDIDNPEDESKILEQAIRSENSANASFFLFISSSIAALIPFTVLFSLIPFIIGIIFYSRAKNSRYITPFGEKRLNTSKTFLIINSVILILWTLLIIAFIAIFL